MFGERFGDRVQLSRRTPHDREVDLVRSQVLDDLFAVADGELDGHFRVSRSEGGEQGRGEILRGAHRSQLQHASLQAAHGRQGLGCFAQQLEGLGRITQQLGTGRCEPHLAPDLLEQRHACFGLEQLDLLRNRGLRQVQLARGACER